MCIALLSLGDKPHGSMVFRVTDKIFYFLKEESGTVGLSMMTGALLMKGEKMPFVTDDE